MENNFSADIPIASKLEDRFQRYEFAKRIAKTIIDRKEEDCLVIGIYGAWGEGKTSIINLIEAELKKNERLIFVKFNPWRYNDENELLLQFFNKLANALKANLKNKSEKAGDLLKKYGKLVSIEIPVIGNVGEKLKDAGDVLGGVDVEVLKTRIEDIIRKNKRKIVITIDDIDRLDKNEIHSVFRLVKLTADFTNTTYILSFDEKMVASALASRFGAGDNHSGENFLEKIIQVPLQIPVAQSEALKTFCIDRIEQVLTTNHIQLNDADSRRFVTEFGSGVLGRIDTPRTAIRYGNTIAFSIPLLQGEVDITDLMLIEAVKIFYPRYYTFIRHNPEYFVGTYSLGFNNGKNKDKVKDIEEQIQKLGDDLTTKQKKAIKKLLEDLFPRLKEAFQNYHFMGAENQWYKGKRIGAAAYFNRYFSYVVIKGEVSDVLFDIFMNQQLSNDAGVVSADMKHLIDQSSPENFMLKLRSQEEDLSWDKATILANAINFQPDLFPSRKETSYLMSFETAYGQAAIFIANLIKNNRNRVQQVELVKNLIINSTSLEFVEGILRWLGPDKDNPEDNFSEEEYGLFKKTLVEKALQDAGSMLLYEKYPSIATSLLHVWSTTDRNALNTYILNILDANPDKVRDIISLFVPIMVTLGAGMSHQTDLSKNNYLWLIGIIDKEILVEYIYKVIAKDTIDTDPAEWDTDFHKFQSNINIIRQFFHWYNLENSKEEKNNSPEAE